MTAMRKVERTWCELGRETSGRLVRYEPFLVADATQGRKTEL